MSIPNELKQSIEALKELSRGANQRYDSFGKFADMGDVLERLTDLADLMTSKVEEYKDADADADLKKINSGELATLKAFKRGLGDNCPEVDNSMGVYEQVVKITREVNKSIGTHKRSIKALERKVEQIREYAVATLQFVRAMMTVHATHTQREGQFILLQAQAERMVNECAPINPVSDANTFDEIPF